ncbi:hypothetical protein [Streptodolium elevatio]
MVVAVAALGFSSHLTPTTVSLVWAGAVAVVGTVLVLRWRLTRHTGD